MIAASKPGASAFNRLPASLDEGAMRSDVVVDDSRKRLQGAKKNQICPPQEKFHTAVLLAVRNISHTL